MRACTNWGEPIVGASSAQQAGATPGFKRSSAAKPLVGLTLKSAWMGFLLSLHLGQAVWAAAPTIPIPLPVGAPLGSGLASASPNAAGAGSGGTHSSSGTSTNASASTTGPGTAGVGGPSNPAGHATDGKLTTPVEPQIKQFAVERSSNDTLLLTVRMRFDLPDAAKDALLKGVSMFFNAELSTVRPRWYWRDEYIVLDRLYWRLTFLPLARRWRLQQASEPWDRQGGLLSDHLYDDLPTALQAMQNLERWPVREKEAFAPNREQKVIFNFELEQKFLSRPVLLGNLSNDVWKLKLSGELNLPPTEATR